MEDFLLEDFNKYYFMLSNWFPDIPESTISQLVIRQFEANETFIYKNQMFHHVLIVLDGICNVINQTDNGTEVLTLKLTQGDLIGVSEQVLHSLRYIASIKSSTQLTVAELGTQEFDDWLSNSPCFVNFVLKNLVTRLHYTADFSANCQSSTSKVNLAKYFMERYNFESTSAGSHGNKTIIIRETHEMISNFLGINTRTVERHIHTLKQEGLISTAKGKVSVSPAQYQKLLYYVTSNL